MGHGELDTQVCQCSSEEDCLLTKEVVNGYGYGFANSEAGRLQERDCEWVCGGLLVNDNNNNSGTSGLLAG
jgi:hypothetical protein